MRAVFKPLITVPRAKHNMIGIRWLIFLSISPLSTNLLPYPLYFFFLHMPSPPLSPLHIPFLSSFSSTFTLCYCLFCISILLPFFLCTFPLSLFFLHPLSPLPSLCIPPSPLFPSNFIPLSFSAYPLFLLYSLIQLYVKVLR